MKRFSKYAALILFVFLATTLAGSMASAKTRIKLSTHFPEGYYINEAYKRIAERVKEETGGDVVIKLFPSSQLGSYEQVFEEVMKGTIEATGTFLTGRFDKRLEMNSLPGLATDYNGISRITLNEDSPYTKQLDTILDGMGLKYLGSFAEGFMGVSLTKGNLPANPFDFENKKVTVRVPGMAVYRDTFQNFGFQTATIPYAEIYTSMQTGVIAGDTGNCSEVNYRSFKDIMAYYIPYNVFYSFNDLVFNKKVWEEKLTQEQRDIIEKAVHDELRVVIAEAEQNDKLYIEKMAEYGIEIVQPTPEQAAMFSDRAQTEIWPKFSDVFGEEFLKDLVSYMHQ